mmetsp:Transcript_26891/g.45039  ORF Transcript_26891/g.45039 Transcript_26891/m.45039 type:complete len:375 (+) Transcript_26891:498-1622(+)
MTSRGTSASAVDEISELVGASLPAVDAEVPVGDTRGGKGEVKVLSVTEIGKVIVDTSGLGVLAHVEIAVSISELLDLEEDVVLRGSRDLVVVPRVGVAEARNRRADGQRGLLGVASLARVISSADASSSAASSVGLSRTAVIAALNLSPRGKDGVTVTVVTVNADVVETSFRAGDVEDGGGVDGGVEVIKIIEGGVASQLEVEIDVGRRAGLGEGDGELLVGRNVDVVELGLASLDRTSSTDAVVESHVIGGAIRVVLGVDVRSGADTLVGLASSVDARSHTRSDDGGSDVELSLPVSVKTDVPETVDGVFDSDLDVLAGAGVLVVVVLRCGVRAGVDIDVDVSELARLLNVHTEAGGGGRDVDVVVLPLESVE